MAKREREWAKRERECLEWAKREWPKRELEWELERERELERELERLDWAERRRNGRIGLLDWVERERLFSESESESMSDGLPLRHFFSKRRAMREMLKEISLDDLKLGAKIGKGAFGLVTRAEYNGHTVAAKLIAVSHYEQEALKLSPHVLDIVGYAKTTDENFVWLIMEMDTVVWLKIEMDTDFFFSFQDCQELEDYVFPFQDCLELEELDLDDPVELLCDLQNPDGLRLRHFISKCREDLAVQLNYEAMREMLKEISLDDLKFGAEIGKGAFGLVTRAEYNGHTVAAKLIDASHYEQEALKLSPHRNVLDIVGYAKTADENFVWLIMEMMDTDFQKYMENHVFTFEDSFDKMDQLAQGMKHLHENGVLHRDLKPSNVLIDLAKGAVKVCDFGNSRRFRVRKLSSEDQWKFLGVSPILTHFDRIQDERSKKEDVHSYGTIYLQLLTGQDPSDGMKPIEVSDIPASHLESIIKCLDQEQLQRLLNLINRCVDQDPDKRPTFDFICEEHQSIKASWVSQKVSSEKRSSYGDRTELELKAENLDLQAEKKLKVENLDLQAENLDLQNISYEEVEVASQLEERFCIGVYMWLILEIMGINLPKYMEVFSFWNLFHMMKTLARHMKDMNDVYYTTKRGTKGYWAPEMNIEADEGNYDEKVDAYSYGVIWWQLLTRKAPIDGMKQLRKDDIDPSHLILLNECLSEEQCQCLFKLINRCLDQNPMNRPYFDTICEELCSIEAQSTFARTFSSKGIRFGLQRIMKFFLGLKGNRSCYSWAKKWIGCWKLWRGFYSNWF